MKNPVTTRILLIDDHHILQYSLSNSLDMEKDMQVIAKADSGIAAIELAEKHHPDVIIMDVAMPDMNGMEATYRICAKNDGIAIIALTMHAEKIYIMGMLNAGAMGYVLKSSPFNELILAIKTVLTNTIYLCKDVSHMIGKNDLVRYSKADIRISSLLSLREREILQLLAEGASTKETSEKLGISQKTVEIHRHNLKKKLHIPHIAGLTKFAVARGITSPYS